MIKLADPLLNAMHSSSENYIAQLESQNKRLRILLDEACDIIGAFAPGHSVWLDAADAALKRREDEYLRRSR